MSLLVAKNLSKFYGPDEIFSGLSLDVPHGARIALVGPNGAGKTTLVNLLIGQEMPTDGQISRAKDASLAFLPQRPELVGDHSLWQEQLRAFDALRQMEAELEALAAQMADPEHHDAALEQYGPLQEAFEQRGGYDYPTRIRMVLTGLGFAQADYETSLSRLSGGQKTRALLARLLLEEPDLLVLDEPTNHLDIAAVEWLESYLKDFPGAVIAVSHDRYFIDKFASTVWELEFGFLEAYRGNYSHYQRQREERRERLQKEYEAQQEFIAKEEAFIRKHMGSRLTAQAQGRQKKLATMRKRGKIIERGPRDRKQMALRIQAARRSGDQVLKTHQLAVGYPDGDAPLFHVPDMILIRGETAAIIGPNGAGKSTLLKTLIGELEPLAGEAKLGANVQLGYFAQAHEGLNPEQSIMDEILELKAMPISEARNYLGRFLFSGDDVYRPIGTLSGGERGRVALAKLALMGANLLLLDEPTNHLDIDSQEILQDVLEHFGGTILLVSHDRYLIDALATQVWHVTGDGMLDVFEGTYSEYVAARHQGALNGENDEANKRRKAAQYAEKKHGLNPRQLQMRLSELENRIETLERTLADLEKEIAVASANGQAAQVQKLGVSYAETEADLDVTMAEWEKLAE